MKGFLCVMLGGLIDTAGFRYPLVVKGLGGGTAVPARVIRRRGGFKVCPMPCDTLPVPGRGRNVNIALDYDT